MFVEHLSLMDFRNYRTAELSLHPGSNVLVGRNGQGKTNLAEAIGYFAQLGSHRVSQDAPMVREGAKAAFVRMKLRHGERSVLVEAQINRSGSNSSRLNGSPVRRTELPRVVHVVLFAPEDLSIVRGDPAERRKFVDQLLIQRVPRLAGTLSDYERVVRQRSALLKSARARGMSDDALASSLDVWNDQLVLLGSQIIRARQRLLEELETPLARAYEAIAGEDHGLRGRWLLSVDAGENPLDEAENTVEARFRAALESKRRAERERGLTLVGPHRDDLELTVRDLPVKGYASHGESWSVALALRLASAQLLREQSSVGDPIVILDDVFAELDQHRRGRLAEMVAEYEQVIVTAAVGTDVPDHLQAHTVHIEAGTIREDGDE